MSKTDARTTGGLRAHLRFSHGIPLRQTRGLSYDELEAIHPPDAAGITFDEDALAPATSTNLAGLPRGPLMEPLTPQLPSSSPDSLPDIPYDSGILHVSPSSAYDFGWGPPHGNKRPRGIRPR